MNNEENKYELIKFEEGGLNLDVNVSYDDETVWLSANQMAKLFDKDETTIRKHVNNVFNEFEVDRNTNTQKMRIAGVDQLVSFYSLNVIISVGYRVKSKRGVMFRQWANKILKEYLIKGFSFNEKRCLECNENIVRLNNEIDKINTKLVNMNDKPKKEYIFYGGDLFEPYYFISKLFSRAKNNIIIIDGYVNIDVLNMLNDVKAKIEIYTYDSAPITLLDIHKFSSNHNLTIVRTNKFHDRYIIIDDDVYLLGSSTKDIGNKLTCIIKTELSKKEIIDKI